MDQDTSSYNKIKRINNEELAELWQKYIDDHDNKELTSLYKYCMYVAELRERCGFDIGADPAASFEKIRKSMDAKPAAIKDEVKDVKK